MYPEHLKTDLKISLTLFIICVDYPLYVKIKHSKVPHDEESKESENNIQSQEAEYIPRPGE